jgi:hypothetical protein
MWFVRGFPFFPFKIWMPSSSSSPMASFNLLFRRHNRCAQWVNNAILYFHVSPSLLHVQISFPARFYRFWIIAVWWPAQNDYSQWIPMFSHAFEDMHATG